MRSACGPFGKISTMRCACWLMPGGHGPAFLLADGTEQYLLTDPHPDRLAKVMPPDRSARWRGLAASVLRESWSRARGGCRTPNRTWSCAGRRRRGGRGGPAGGRHRRHLQPGVRRGRPRGAENGERMPRKSTSFGPKPRTGLVMRTFGTS